MVHNTPDSLEGFRNMPMLKNGTAKFECFSLIKMRNLLYNKDLQRINLLEKLW